MMRGKKSKTLPPGFSRRQFLLTVGATAPTLNLMEGSASGAPNPAPETEAGDAEGKFTPLDLSAHFNSSSREFGPRERAALIGGDSAHDFLIRVPGGKRDLQGIPFILGPEDLQSKGWLVLRAKSRERRPPAWPSPWGGERHFLCVASFSDFDENEVPGARQGCIPKGGPTSGGCHPYLRRWGNVRAAHSPPV